MESLVKQGLEYFFPGGCYETVVERGELGNAQCMQLLNSRILSLTVLLGAVIVKVPQIVKVVQAGSAEGLSYAATLMELLAVTFTSTYNLAKGFTFSSWGESFFIAVQLLVLLALMFYYNHHLVYLVVMAPIYGGVVWYLTSDLASIELLSSLQAAVIPLMTFSRMTQIYTTYSNKSTGQLSLITSFLNWAGTASRIFTTLQETQDLIMLIMYITSFTLNGVILLQFFIYRDQGKQEKQQKKLE